MFRVLVTDPLGEAGLERLESAPDATHTIKLDMADEALATEIAGYDAVIVRSATRVSAEVIAAATGLKVIGRAGIGVDNIDVKAATGRGILVMNTPEANAIATAEHTIALLLASARMLVPAHLSTARGEWDRTRFTGRELHRKTLGLIGLGRVGRLVASRAKGFGMDVTAFDPYVSEEVGRELGVTLVELDDLLPVADYLSMHAVSSPETCNMIDTAAIGRMKEGVIIVNAARADLIDEVALADGLRSGKVRHAAVDVFSREPPGRDHPLLGLHNVTHTPHLGAGTEEAQADVAVQIVDQVLEALRGKEFRNAINIPFSAGAEYEAVLPYMRLAEKMGALQFHMAAPDPVRRVEVELKGDAVESMARPVATALLKGLLQGFLADSVNFINAPVLAEQHGIQIAQSKGVSASDYPNLISCRAHWDGGSRVISGVLFAGDEPRIVQVSQYHLDADPRGVLLIVRNDDVPGVIGQVGTILGAYGVNIGEWRMGRNVPGEEALSFINLDAEPSAAALDALAEVSAITRLMLLNL